MGRKTRQRIVSSWPLASFHVQNPVNNAKDIVTFGSFRCFLSLASLPNDRHRLWLLNDRHLRRIHKLCRVSNQSQRLSRGIFSFFGDLCSERSWVEGKRPPPKKNIEWQETGIFRAGRFFSSPMGMNFGDFCWAFDSQKLWKMGETQLGWGCCPIGGSPSGWKKRFCFAKVQSQNGYCACKTIWSQLDEEMTIFCAKLITTLHEGRSKTSPRLDETCQETSGHVKAFIPFKIKRYHIHHDHFARLTIDIYIYRYL